MKHVYYNLILILLKVILYQDDYLRHNYPCHIRSFGGICVDNIRYIMSIAILVFYEVDNLNLIIYNISINSLILYTVKVGYNEIDRNWKFISV